MNHFEKINDMSTCDYHKYKLYRVKKLTDRCDNVVYKVQATTNLFEAILGFWVDFEKDNHTIDEAKDQIETIDSCKLKKQKVVHRERRD